MSIDRIARLKALHLYGMAATWAEWQAESCQRPAIPEVWLDRLIAAEEADRQARSLRYQLTSAHFPIHRDLLGFDWAETPLQQAHIEQLATAAFMGQAHNLILVGGTGTGKTHLATALGIAAIHLGKRVRFYNAVDLVNQLEKEKRLGKAGNLAKSLIPIDAVILDELGYLPFPDAGGAQAVPPDQQTLRKDLADHHHQPQLRGMGTCFRRCQDDHSPLGPHHPPLRHPGNRQRLLPVQAE
jgi:DNA replication protein DnaC